MTSIWLVVALVVGAGFHPVGANPPGRLSFLGTSVSLHASTSLHEVTRCNMRRFEQGRCVGRTVREIETSL